MVLKGACVLESLSADPLWELEWWRAQWFWREPAFWNHSLQILSGSWSAVKHYDFDGSLDFGITLCRPSLAAVMLYVRMCVCVCCIVLYCVALYCVVFCCIALYCIALYYIELCCVVLCCVVLWKKMVRRKDGGETDNEKNKNTTLRMCGKTLVLKESWVLESLSLEILSGSWNAVKFKRAWVLESLSATMLGPTTSQD